MAPLRNPPLPEALTILREIRGWSKVDLSRAAGLSASAISCYESGGRTPKGDQLRLKLLATMGFPAFQLQRTYAFIRATRAAREHRLAAAAGALDARIDGFVAEFGMWTEALVRDVLAAALAEAHALAPDPQPPAAAAAAAGRPAPALAAPDGSTRKDLGASSMANALVILRIIRGWGRDDLARATGMPGETIANYERGKSRPALPALERLLAALGFQPADFDRCIAFVEAARETLGQRCGAGEDALRAQAAEIATRHARLAEDYAHRGLEDLATAARVLISRSLAPGAWALLSRHADPVRLELVAHAARFQTAGLCELLCEESLAVAGDSAEHAGRLAELAVAVAENMSGPEGLRSRLRGYAGVHVANAVRIAGDDLPAAADAFARARELWESGADADPGLVNAARVLGLEASLRRAQRRVPEALALLDRALAIDRWGETPTLFLAKARALFELGKHLASIDALHAAAGLIDGERAPRQRLIALDLLADNLCLLGRHAVAAEGLAELQALGQKLGNRLDLVRLRWLEGKIAAGLRRPEEAIAKLAGVRESFKALGSSYDIALVTVELAGICAGLGRHAEVKRMARESVPIFQDQGVHVEARRALALFCRAAEQERASVELLHSLLAYLYRARHDPQLRFDAAA